MQARHYMANPNFQNCLVLTLESRRALEIRKLISTYGGRVLSAPALREVPLESNTEALAFARELVKGHFAVVVFLTGVGLRALIPQTSRELFRFDLAFPLDGAFAGTPRFIAAFESAFRKAQTIIASMPGYRWHELQRCLEREGHYLLLVRWDSVQDHEEGFRKSPQYQEWKRLLHHFYDPFPTVLHYETVTEG